MKVRRWTIFNGHVGAAREFIKGDDIAYAENVHVVERKAYYKAVDALKETSCDCYAMIDRTIVCHRCTALKDLGEL